MQLKNFVLFPSIICLLTISTGFATDNPCKSAQHATYRVPHPTNCSEFYQCSCRGAVNYALKACPSGLEFNPDNGMCDRIEQLRCSSNYDLKQSTASASTAKSKKSLSAKTPINRKNYCPNSYLNGKPVCPDKLKHVLPHPVDCTKYCECHDGSAVEKNCHLGTYFALRTGSCDAANIVFCGKNRELEEPDNLYGIEIKQNIGNSGSNIHATLRISKVIYASLVSVVLMKTLC